MESCDCEQFSLDCAFCKRPFRNATVLPCRHNFCRRCVEDLVRQHDKTVCALCNNNNDDSSGLCHLRCPTCQRDLDLSGDQGVDQLPTNTVINNLIDVVCKREDEFFEVLGLYSEGEEDDDQDDDEEDDDRTMSIVSSTPSEEPEEPPEGARAADHLTGSSGLMEDRMFRPVCGEGSWGFGSDILDGMMSSCEAVSREFLAEADNSIDFVRDKIKLTKLMAVWVDSSAEATAAEVVAAFDRHRRALDDRQRIMLEHIGQVRRIRKRSFEQQLVHLWRIHDDLERAKGDVSQALVWKTDWDLLRSWATVLRQTQEVQDLHWHPSPQRDDSFTFAASDGALFGAIDSFGEVSSCGYGPTSRVFGEGLRRALVDRAAGFVVAVKDHLGEPMRAGGDPVEVVVRVSGGDLLTARVLDRRDGTYRVSYQPSAVVRHQVHVSVRGFPLTGSPFEVAVGRCRDYRTVGPPLIVFGEPGSGNGQFCRPWGVCCDSRGNVVVADRSNGRIQVLDRFGNFLTAFGKDGTGAGQLHRPAGVAVDTRNDGEDRIIVADKDNHRVQIFAFSGQALHAFGERGCRDGQFNYPWDVAVNPETHEIAVTDSRNFRVQLFTQEGHFVAKFCFSGSCLKELDSPRGVAFDHRGNAVVTDFNHHRLLVLDRNFNFCRFVGCPASGEGGLLRPQGIDVDHEGNYVVADSKNLRVAVLRPSGAIVRTFGRTGLPSRAPVIKPMDVAVAPDGLVYVVDYDNNRILAF